VSASRAPAPSLESGSLGLGVEVPRVPEPYTGDPEGQALWERVVEEDQQTPQPEDFEDEPPVQRLELSKLPAYAEQNIDADGNLN
jgi:hypothetical protein